MAIIIQKTNTYLSHDEMRQIAHSLNDIKVGKVLTLKKAEKSWGI